MKYEEINEVCDLELATSIARKIREIHTDISDKDLMQYFKNSLEHIRETKVNKKREESRVQRLSLRPNFNNWQASDVES